MVTGQREIKLKMSQKFSPYGLVFTMPEDAAFTVPKDATRLLGEKGHQQSDSAMNPRCNSNDIPSKTCSVVKLQLNCYRGNNHFLIRGNSRLIL